jgi:hypothetical protein
MPIIRHIIITHVHILSLLVKRVWQPERYVYIVSLRKHCVFVTSTSGQWRQLISEELGSPPSLSPGEEFKLLVMAEVTVWELQRVHTPPHKKKLV